MDGTLQGQMNGFVYGAPRGIAGWYYVENGKLNLDYRDVVSGTINGEEADWYVENGKATVYSGAVKKDEKIVVVKDGRVDESYTGVACYNGLKYYAEEGTVDLNYTGVAKNSSGWWNVKNGRIDDRQTKIIENEGDYYYVRGGKVDFNYSGVAGNEVGMWKVTCGEVNFDYTDVARAETGILYYISGGMYKDDANGFISCNSGNWYVTNGIVDTSTMGRVSGRLDGVDGEYPVVHGLVVEEAQYIMATKANDYSSETEWMMMIDSTYNRVGVFRGSQGNWELVKYWVCTTGDASDPEAETVKGEYEITDNRGYYFSDYDYTCYYYSGFYGPYLFHSTLYQRGTFEDLNASLGGNASHGCVRLAIENAKWVYYNIPVGTKVLSY